MHKIIYIIFLIVFIVFLKQDIIIKPSYESVNKNEFPKEYPNDWFSYQRCYPYEEINVQQYLASINRKPVFNNIKNQNDIEWDFCGPLNIGGRITDIEIVPDDPSIVFVGGASGGILKTTDNGNNWVNTFSHISSISIGDLAIDPNNQNIIYAGTGESNATSYSYLGSGIYKSVDTGETWSYSGLGNSAFIGRIVVDYSNSDRIFVAACGNLFTTNNERGIYRSINGGETWDQVLFLTDSTSAIDIVQHPEDPEILYAAMWERRRGINYRNSFGETSGIWKSADGGNNWSELLFGLPNNAGVGRIGIDISRSNPDVLYAMYDIDGEGIYVYKTTNGGSSWQNTSDYVLRDICRTYGWFFGQIRVDPFDEDIVYAMGLWIYRTTNGGNTWYNISETIHVDHHALVFDTLNNKVINGNDGGLYVSENDCNTWFKINNLPLTQFYDITVDKNNPERIMGGTQDNGVILTSSGMDNNWEKILGGDGMVCVFDYSDMNTFYCANQFGVIHRTKNNGYSFENISDDFSNDRTNWVTPYIIHPLYPNIFYAGTYRIWKTTDQGDNWYTISNDLTNGNNNNHHTITCIDISKLNPEILVVGTADGKVHTSDNDGISWADRSNGLPNRWITSAKTGPFNENVLFVTVSGYKWDEFDSHVFISNDFGLNWEAIGNDLPDVPVNDIIIDPNKPGNLFIGTDAGVFKSPDSGQEWLNISNNLPNAPFLSLDFHNSTRTLFASTYGVSAYKLPVDLLSGIKEKLSSHELNINIYPNPFNNLIENTYIELELQKTQNVYIEIYKITGERIFNFYQPCETGKNLITWNGENKLNKKASAGLYICKVYAIEGIADKKILIL